MKKLYTILFSLSALICCAGGNHKQILSEDTEVKGGKYRSMTDADFIWRQSTQTISNNPKWREWFNNQVKELDNWMELNRENYLVQAGWAYNYINPKTGRFLYWSPTSKSPISADEKVKLAWLFFVREHNMEMMLDAARIYKVTGKAKYRNWCVKQLNAYAENYANIQIKDSKRRSRLFLQGLDEATNSFKLIEVLRLIKSEVDREVLESWRINLFGPMAQGFISLSKADHNKTVWLASAIYAIGLEFSDKRLLDYSINSSFGVNKVLSRCVSPDGFWCETSLHYQYYVVKALYELLYAAKARNANSAELNTIYKKALQMILAPLDMRFSDNLSPRFNDSLGKAPKLPNIKFLKSIYPVFPFEFVSIEFAKDFSWDALLTGNMKKTIGYSLSGPESKKFPGMYAAQLVNEDWHVLLRYGQGKHYHAHQESLSYDIEYKGDMIFNDIGTVGYGSPLHRNYFKRAHSSNTVLINRDGQRPWPSIGSLESFNSMGSLSVSHANYQPGNFVKRKLKLNKGAFKDITTFKLKNNNLVGLVYNTDCRVDASERSINGSSIGSKGPFKYWKEIKHYPIRNNTDILLKCKSMTYLMKVSGPDLASLYIAKTPNTYGNSRNGIYIETSKVNSTAIDVEIIPL